MAADDPRSPGDLLFFQAEDGIRDLTVTGVQTCALPISYPEPERFRPDRFLERPAGTYTWMPFGGGVRRCLGASFAQLEMKQVLRTVVARAEIGRASCRGRG